MALTQVQSGMMDSIAQYNSFKNRIINGNCAINQRSTALSTTNTNGYFVDRMWGFSGVSTASTFSQISSTGLDGFPNAARAQRNSGNTGTANYYTGQIIESKNLQDLQGQTVTLSFWARCGANFSAPSSLAVVSISTGTAADQGLASYLANTWTGVVNQQTTITLTTSWQKFTYTATLGSTIQELMVYIGSNGLVGTAGANDYIDVTGWQLEKGSTATAFDYRPYTTELQLCQRYFETWENIGVVGGYTPAALGAAQSTSQSNHTYFFKVNKRVSPTFSYSALADFTVLYNGGVTVSTLTALGQLYPNTNCSQLQATVSGTPFVAYQFSYVAAKANTTTAVLSWSAEL